VKYTSDVDSLSLANSNVLRNGLQFHSVKYAFGTVETRFAQLNSRGRAEKCPKVVGNDG
jgi:hypothetical protein